MCGTGFMLASCPAEQVELDTCLSALRRRGPDADTTTLVQLQNGAALHLMAAVLHLRGERMCLQPAEDAHGNILLWNGEVFGGLDVGPLESDTYKVLQMLSGTSTHQQVVSALAGLSGPFSFVYWVPERQALYYGRDAIGRRSLVIRRPRAPGGPLIVLSCLPEEAGIAIAESTSSGKTSSVAGSETGHQGVGLEGGGVDGTDIERGNSETAWEEVRADGIYSLRLETLNGGGDWSVPPPVRHPWPVSSDVTHGTTTSSMTHGPPVVEPSMPSHCRRQLPSTSSSVDGVSEDSSSSGGCNGRASPERERREGYIAPPPPPPSTVSPSGRDVMVGRSGAQREEEKEEVVMAGLPSTIERMRIPASNCAGSAMDNEQGRQEDDDDNKHRGKEGGKCHGRQQQHCGLLSEASSGLLFQLRRSIRRRVQSIPYTKRSMPPDRRKTEEGGEANNAHFRPNGLRGVDERGVPVSARVGVLFSGGLDSVVLAAMLAEGGGEGDGGPAVPEGEAIDLINVCFDSPSGHTSPDRLASMAAVRELQALFPSHAWRLLCVDASYEDVLRHRKAIWRVMQPCSTTMDFNISAAFWFASRGRGWLYRPPLQPATPPSPPPPVLLESLARRPRVGDSSNTSARADLEEEVGCCSGEKIDSVPASVDLHVNKIGRAASGTGDDDKSATAAVLPEDGPAPPEEQGRNGGENGSSSCCKVNKNQDKLCPVGGCRRLLKPGCVFGSCSRCCLKAQGFLDDAEDAQHPAAAVAMMTFDRQVDRTTDRQTYRHNPSSVSSVSASAAEDDIAKEEDAVEADVVAAAAAAAAAIPDGSGVPDSVVPQGEPLSAATVAEAGEGAARRREKNHQLQCKARAVSQALRSLEAHLTSHFDELSSPFRAAELALLLRRDASACQVKVGRDVHFRSPALNTVLAGYGSGGGGLAREALAGNSSRKAIKWCPTHKSRPRGDGQTEGGALQGDGLELGAEEGSSAGRAVSAAMLTSAVRVLLVGIGADEFMAGYSRHRNAYNRGGAAALTEELLKDQGRLWTRNLGRDDRSIADHGREARFPFLDEDVVGFIRSLPLRDVCNMEEPPGVGDKKILRDIASYLGLDSCRSLPKRAIQFGSRIAQHCARHTHGSHRRGNGADPAYLCDP